MKVKNLKTNKQKKHFKKGVDDKDIKLVEASISQISYIDYLLSTSIISLNEIKEINTSLNQGISKTDVEKLIEYLLENQKDLIDSGGNYQQKDILNKLKKFC